MPSASRWDLPAAPWVLHVAPFVESDDPGWIDVQAREHERFDARLLCMRIVGPEPRRSYWLAADDRKLDYLAFRAAHLTDGRSMRLLTRRIGDRRPAILHGHYGPTAVQVRRMAAKLDVPLVASFYGYDASVRSIVDDAGWRARYGRLFERVAAVMVEGPAMGARVNALGCPDDRIRVVRLPIDESDLPQRRLAPDDAFIVTIAGRLTEKKGFDTAISAFARALRGRDARLVVVGSGELEDDFRQLAAREGIEEQVRWLGRLPHREFLAAAAAGDLALFPSRTADSGDAEGGAPVTLIELQWLGVPAIVSDHDDLSFAAAPELPVLRATDIDAWAETLLTYYENREALVALGEAAAAFVRARNSIAENVRARELVYTQALA